MLSISNTPNHNSVPGQTRTVNTRFVAEWFIQLAYGDLCSAWDSNPYQGLRRPLVYPVDLTELTALMGLEPIPQDSNS